MILCLQALIGIYSRLAATLIKLTGATARPHALPPSTPASPSATDLSMSAQLGLDLGRRDSVSSPWRILLRMTALKACIFNYFLHLF